MDITTTTTTAIEADLQAAQGAYTVTSPRAELAISFVAGFLFAAGLVVSGMTQPDKVIGFLDIQQMFVGVFPGQWDPSLGFLMLGAVVIALIGFSATPYASAQPWFTSTFFLPRFEPIDGRLMAGAALFGVGWGLSGYCPGPVVASLFIGQIDTVVFAMAMFPGMWLARKLMH